MATQQPIRIMRIIARLNIGGPAIHVSLLTARLCPPTYESLLVCGPVSDAEGDMGYYAEQQGITPQILPDLGRDPNPISDLRVVWQLYRLMRQYRPDVVHTHTAKAGFVGRLAARLAGVPVIVHTFHGHVFRGYFSPFVTQIYLWLERFAASLSDSIITLTESLRRELSDVYRIARRARITVLPLGLDLEPFARTPRRQGTFRARCGIPPDAPLVGIVGRMVPVKNHALFIEAAARLHAQRPDLRFAIVGDGELRADVEALVRDRGLQEVVVLTGWEKDTPAVYSDLDVLVISSINEGTPVTVIEALAAGCPVVSTAVGGVTDLLENGTLGVLVPPDDPEALAAAILRTVVEPPDVRAAQRTMIDRYGIDRLVRDLDSLYRGLLLRKRPRR